MLGVDDRLVTPATLKWVKVGLIAGLATIPTTIVLYYVLGLTVDAALAGTNQVRDWLFVLTFLVLLKAGLAWLFRTGQFRAPGPLGRARQHILSHEPGRQASKQVDEIIRRAAAGDAHLKDDREQERIDQELQQRMHEEPYCACRVTGVYIGQLASRHLAEHQLRRERSSHHQVRRCA